MESPVRPGRPVLKDPRASPVQWALPALKALSDRRVPQDRLAQPDLLERLVLPVLSELPAPPARPDWLEHRVRSVRLVRKVRPE
jgi:hypothetical protein